MAGRELKRRIDTLEATANLSGPLRWRRVLQLPGQTEAQARAAYEAEHGLIGSEDGIIVRAIVS
jgi:hypothetical protein